MNKLPILLFLAALLSGIANAAGSLAATDEVAQRMTSLSVRQELAANDPRVAQTRTLLDKAARLSLEEPMAIEAACSRYVGHLHDSAHIEAAPLELLEALVSFGKAGKPMRDTLQDYVVARKAAPGKSHAEAMAVLGRKK
jgi:hypothetical protein